MVVLWAAFAPPFSDRVWAHAPIRAIGALRATGTRTVPSASRLRGLSPDEHFTNYPRLLNRAAWGPRAARRIVLQLSVLALVPADRPIALGADDPLERRHGREIKAQGRYRDAVRSSPKGVVKCLGSKSVAMTVLVPLPGNPRVKAPPCRTVWGGPEATPRRRAPKTSIAGVRQSVLRVRRGFPQRRVMLVLEGGLAAGKRAPAGRRPRVTRIGRPRLEAGWDDPPGERPASKRRPEPENGPRQVPLREWARREDPPWEDREVEWSGGERETMRLFSGTGPWSTAGEDPVALGFLRARDPAGAREDAGSLGTAEEMLPEAILRDGVGRGSVAVTFEGMRAQLGREPPRRWSDRALQRTPPVLLGRYWLVVRAAARCHEAGRLWAEETAWSAQEGPTSSDCLRLIRSGIWPARMSPGSHESSDPIRLPRGFLDALIHGVASAA